MHHLTARPPRSLIALAGLLLTAVFMFASYAAPSDALATRYYELRARHSDKCLDVANISTAHAANVIQGNCWGGYNQQWRLQRNSSGYYAIIARHSGQCLDVAYASTLHGADVIQGTCYGGTNQQWRMVPTDSDFYRLVARNSGKCLDVANLSIAHAADVIQGTCWNPGPNQQWRFRFMADA